MFWRTLSLFCVVIGAQSISSPYLTPCDKRDSVCQTKNLNTIYKLSVKGVPELNIDSLEPMQQNVIEGNFLVVSYRLNNSTFKGFGTCDVVDTKLDMENSTLSFDMFCPVLYMNGLYEAHGQILSMPIDGKGDFNVMFKDYRIRIDIDTKISQGTDGKDHLSLKSYKVSTELQGSMNSHLSNLFNGQNPELAENLLRFINMNAKTVTRLFDGPLFNTIVKKLVKNLNKYMKNVSLDQLIKQYFVGI